MYLSHLGCLCFSPAVSAVSFQACIGHKVCSHLKLPTTVPIQPPRVVGSVTDVYSTLVFVTVRINPQYFCPGEHFRKKRWLKPFWGLLPPTFRCFMPLFIGCQLIQQSHTQDLVHKYTYTLLMEYSLPARLPQHSRTWAPLKVLMI